MSALEAENLAQVQHVQQYNLLGLLPLHIQKGYYDDKPWDAARDGEPPQDEVSGDVDAYNGVDVIDEQVPSPQEQGEYEAQESDVQVPVILGEGGIAKSRTRHSSRRTFNSGAKRK